MVVNNFFFKYRFNCCIFAVRKSNERSKNVQENLETQTNGKRDGSNAHLFRHTERHSRQSPARYKKRLTDGFITLTHANYQPTSKNASQPPKRPCKRNLRQGIQYAVVETSPGASVEERPVFMPTMPRKRDSETSRASTPHHATINLCR